MRPAPGPLDTEHECTATTVHPCASTVNRSSFDAWKRGDVLYKPPPLAPDEKPIPVDDQILSVKSGARSCPRRCRFFATETVQAVLELGSSVTSSIA